MSSPREIYTERVTKFEAEGRILLKNMGRISLLRLAVGLATGFAFYFGYADYAAFYIAAGLLFAVFIYLVNHHVRLKARYTETRILIDLNENELKSLAGGDDHFDYNPGADYSNHIYANDLDIFGRLSLFRQINRATTPAGKQMLIDNLLDPNKAIPVILERKHLLSELSPVIEWRQQLYAIGAQSGEKPGDIQRLTSWNEKPRFLAHRKHWIAIAALMSASMLGLILYMSFSGKVDLSMFIVLLVINTSIHQLFFKKQANTYFSHFGDYSALFSNWSDRCVMITAQPFESALGTKLKSQVAGASRSFREISNLNKLIGYRMNEMMLSLMNGLCLFDVWFILQIENWRSKNGHGLSQWIDTIHQVDFLNSFANFRFNHPAFCNAEIVEGPNRISATRMGHPLIQPDRLVPNDFEIGISANAHIITGSNMSGKSTFLRAVGLNMVLALNGLPVCANSFSCSNLSIATSIRITDSLEENESYFRAEIKKLSQIMKLLGSGRPYLVLLDELLRGTNATDKQTGTRLFYQRLANQNCVALLATHDPEIGNLAKETPDHFQNFHFESFIEGGELRFDYLLRQGVSVTKNATLLMKQLNLI